jgi:hypothetical protein
MPDYAIVVAQRVPTRQLIDHDRVHNPRGAYMVTAKSEEAALEAFHDGTPIHEYRDFAITTTQVSPPRRRRSR